MTDLSFTREFFPALERNVGGFPAAFLDGPGGTQVPRRVVAAVSDYLIEANANVGGPFVTTRLTDDVINGARAAAAALLGADPGEIAFGANMTTLNYSLALALGRDLGPGDRIVITDLDHEANRGPWLDQKERGVEVVSAPIRTDSCTLDMGALLDLIDDRTRVVAVGAASNALGTVTDLAPIIEAARAVGAVTVVDAVHYVPHSPVDVRVLGCDFLMCSAYKFFGPHVGILYGRKEAFERLRAYRIWPQKEYAPNKIETGTLNHEGLAGVTAAVEFIAGMGLGQEWAAPERSLVIAGMEAAREYEDGLSRRLLDGLSTMDWIKVYGPPPGSSRTPTVSFTVRGMSPWDTGMALAEQGIFVWDGHFYAKTLIARLGLLDEGGVIRVGFAPYNTIGEVDRLLGQLEALKS